MCLPGLHITLGIFLRLFTLLEDECHKLDLELVSATVPQSGDRAGYVDFAQAIQKERALLDLQVKVEAELQFLHQTISLLALTSTDPSTDPQMIAVAEILNETKTKQEGMEHI